MKKVRKTITTKIHECKPRPEQDDADTDLGYDDDYSDEHERQARAACEREIAKLLPESSSKKHVVLIDKQPEWLAPIDHWGFQLTSPLERAGRKAINRWLSQNPGATEIKTDLLQMYMELDVDADTYLKIRIVPKVLAIRSSETGELYTAVRYSLEIPHLWHKGESIAAKRRSVGEDMTQNWLEVGRGHYEVPFPVSVTEKAVAALKFDARSITDVYARMRPATRCYNCARPLTDQVSRVLFYGPTCAKNIGIPHNAEIAREVIAKREELKKVKK